MEIEDAFVSLRAREEGQVLLAELRNKIWHAVGRMRGADDIELRMIAGETGALMELIEEMEDAKPSDPDTLPEPD